MEELLRNIRSRASAHVWDQGVKLARDGAVDGDRDDGDEVEFRVRAPGRAAAPTVVLYPEDGEWDCDCGARAVCSHVAAAAIALSRARKEGEELPAARGSTRVVYRLLVHQDRLGLERFLVGEDGVEEPIPRRLPISDPRVLTSSVDLVLDRRLAGRLRATPSLAELPELFGALAEVSDLKLHDRPIRTSPEPVSPEVKVRDASGGAVELVIERAGVDEVVAAGVCRIGDTLHPLAETELTGPMLEALPFTRRFDREDFGNLVTDLLPELGRRVAVKVATDRLPGLSRTSRPRITLEVEQEGSTLSVMPLLVYGDPPQARIDGDRLVHLRGSVPVRDRGAEKRLIFRLRDELNLAPGRSVELSGREAIAFAQKLAEWRGDLGSSAKRLFRDEPLSARLDISGDSFDVKFETADGARASPQSVVRAWRDAEPLVPIEGGGWAPLPSRFLAEHGHLIADLLASRDAKGRVRRHALPDLARLCHELDYPEPPGLERLRPLLEGFSGIEAPELPADLTAELRSYQKVGVAWLCFLRELGLGGVLADDMGLGKTVQALCAVRGRTLVVCPTSVLHNWKSEITRFRPSLRAELYHGPGRELDPDADLTITTYSLLRNDVELLANEAWDTVILDEAQNIKNPDSQGARAAYRLQGEFRLTLTGTPIENRLDELWSQLHFTNPGLLGGRSDFRDRYERPIADGDSSAAARLRARIRPFVLRRLKSEVERELPPRTEAVLRCELDRDERALYDAVRAAARAEVLEKLEAGSGVFAALEALLRLRQASCHPALLPGREAERSSKLDLMLELVEEAVAEGHKALIFSQWTSLLDLVEPYLERSEIAFTRLDGSTRDRAGVVARFQDADGPPILLVSLKAGGTGLNLTAADHVVLLDPWWNPAVEEQAADRAHRIGQDRPVFVYRLVARDTVEERVLSLQAKKRKIAEAALGEADRAAAVTREELLELLG